MFESTKGKGKSALMDRPVNNDFRAAMETEFAAAEITGDLLQEMKDHYWKEERKFGSSASIRNQKVLDAADEVHNKAVHAEEELKGFLRLFTLSKGLCV